jgi:ribosomal protein L11 methyltransferase
LALDIDDLAVKATAENAAHNGVQDRITVQEGSLETLKGTARHFDLLLCNILAKVIIQLCADGLGDVLRPGGKAILSGIIEDQADGVEDALRATGLDPVRRRSQGDWVVIEAHKPQS